MTNLLALHFRDTSRNREEQQSYSDWQDVVREAWTDSAEADAIAHRFEWLQKDMDENPEDYRRWRFSIIRNISSVFRISRGSVPG